MLDAIFESIGRFIAHYVFGTIFEAIFYWPGWLILRLITVGRYPPVQVEKHNRTGVAWFGFVAIVIAIAIHTYSS
jgi:hypothetical protein